MPETGLPNGATTIIESLGVYLPTRELTTAEVLRGCRSNVRFPLERMTGIKSRRVASESEFAIDLAREAVAKCLASSRYAPGDVDLVISAGIARVDGPDFQVSYEPSTAGRLKTHFGFDRALAFDVRSACSGMWIGIGIADALIRQGTIARALIVSGEYISHLTATAQIEIEDFLDNRLACLTLGDSGAAVMLDHASGGSAGFAAVELCTLGGYAHYCVAGPTDRAHGGAIMVTDALKLTDAATRHGSDHAVETLERAGWPHESFQHLIMHQTSRTALTGAMRAINRRMRREVCHDGNTINNLAQRGNTATTTQLVALADQMATGRIRSGDRVIFSISGSGLTFGTALYTLDDLPDRVAGPAGTRRADPAPAPARPAARALRGRVASIGTAPRKGELRDSIALLSRAATDCLSSSGTDANAVGLIIYAGVYRTDFVKEPAMAALLAGALGINTTAARNGHRTLAFDILNGGVGILNACWTALEMIRAGKTEAALVVASDIENNAVRFPDNLLGIEETGSALLLTGANGDGSGFGSFRFESFPEHSEAFVSHLTNRDGKPWLRFKRAASIECLYVTALTQTVARFLHAEGRDISSIARIFAPQISWGFLTTLAAAIGAPRASMIDVVYENRDLSTSSLPFALRHAQEHGLVQPGDVGLILCVGSGIEVGCALYHF